MEVCRGCVLGNATDGFGLVSASVKKGSLVVNATIDRTVAALTYVRFVLDANNSLTLPATAVYSVDDSGGWLRRDERMPLHRNASFDAATFEFDGRGIRADPQPVETLKGSGLAWASLSFGAARRRPARPQGSTCPSASPRPSN